MKLKKEATSQEVKVSDSDSALSGQNLESPFGPTANVDLPKFDASKDYYLEYWKTFMDIKIAREELMQWSDK